MAVTDLMVNTCTITPRTEGRSATTGGVTYTDGTAVTGVACNLQQISGFESMTAGRESGKRAFNVYFPIGTTIPLNATLSAFAGSSIGNMSGVLLEVKSPGIDPSGRGTYLMVTAEETPGGGT